MRDLVGDPLLVVVDDAADDIQALITDNALVLKHGIRPQRGDYDRRTTFLLDGIHRAGAADRG